MNSTAQISRRWRLAQQAEAEGWKGFGPAPRHFTQEYWDWELGFFGLSIDYFNNLSGVNLLEVGGGPFGMIHFIKTKDVRFSIEPLAVDLKRLGFESKARDVLQIAAMGEALPIANEMVDLIICFNVLDHVAMPEEVLKECKRVLRPQGTLLFNVNIIRPSLRPFRPLLSRIDKSHPFHWVYNEVLRMLDDAGFEVVFRSCLPRNNYKFSLINFLSRRREPESLPHNLAYLRVGEKKYIPATGSALRHLGSNLLHLRLDLRAQKRSWQ